MKRIALLLVLATVIFIPTSMQGAQSPEALAILDQYKATMEKQSRIWFTCNVTAESKEYYTNSSFLRYNGTRRIFEKREIRSDGSRVVTRVSQWGHVPEVAPRVVVERDAIYRSWLWDGENYYSYNKTFKPGVRPDSVQILGKKTLSKIDFNLINAPVLQFSQLDYSGQRIDTLLRDAKDLRVRPVKETVNGTSCLVLEAKTPDGKYTVCFDPERGHQIVRAHVLRNPGDRWETGVVLKEGQRLAYQISDVRLISTNGTWVPVEATISTRKELMGNQYCQCQMKFTCTDLKINPDFEKSKAFLPDDIRDGSDVEYIDRKRVHYKWKNGQVQK